MAKILKKKDDVKSSRREDQNEFFRWSINQAALEFGGDRVTISKKLRRAGQMPGEDGFYSTSQLVKAIYGDLEKERTRKTKNDADRSAMANAKLSKNLVTRQNALTFIVGVAGKVRGIIMGSDLGERDKRDILEELQVCFDEKHVTNEICPDERYEDLIEAAKEAPEDEEE